MLPKSGHLIALILLLAVGACAPTSPSSSRSAELGGTSPDRTGMGPAKTIRIATSQDLTGIGMGQTGGLTFFNEIHSNGLVTSDRDVWRPVPQIADRVPSLDNGLIEMLPDGRMKTTYPLRKDVTWHDGAPLTAQDMGFAYELNSDPELPLISREFVSRIDTIQAPDDSTLTIYWKSAYYLADSLGVTGFWPWPKHILEESYRSLDKEAFSNLPYWTSGFVHAGPFRVAEYEPRERVVFTTYDKYFRGKPKVDRIILTQVRDTNALLAMVKAGEVDIISDVGLPTDVGVQLQKEWAASREGEVNFAHGGVARLRYLLNTAFQTAPGLFDKRVRQAVFMSLDREGIALRQGNEEFAANELVAPGHPLHDAVKGSFTQFAFNPPRARQSLADLGYRPDRDGVLVGSDGNRLEFPIWTWPGGEQITLIIQDNLKDVGITASTQVIPRGMSSDREYRATRPGAEVEVRAVADGFLTEVESAQVPSAQNRWVGFNRSAYSNPIMDDLILSYRTNMRQSERDMLLRRIHEVLADDIPIAPLVAWPLTPSVRTGVKALEDWRGGQYGQLPFGTFSRHSYEWDVSRS